MKKYFALAFAVLAMAGFTFAAVYNLPDNSSKGIFFPIQKGDIKGTGYMKVLNSVSTPDIPDTATTAMLTTTLDKVGTVKNNYKKNTYTITVGYTSCKVNDYVNRTELPKVITVDLTNVKCLNKKQPVNFLPLLQKGQRINVFFAKQNGTTHDTSIVIK